MLDIYWQFSSEFFLWNLIPRKKKVLMAYLESFDRIFKFWWFNEKIEHIDDVAWWINCVRKDCTQSNFNHFNWMVWNKNWNIKKHQRIEIPQNGICLGRFCTCIGTLFMFNFYYDSFDLIIASHIFRLNKKIKFHLKLKNLFISSIVLLMWP